MAWRLARSLEQLRNEVNARWPNRSKASDGTIGDTAHAASASDHNPNAAGVVCAFDITHDPDSGPDCNVLVEQLRDRQHPDAKYLIWDGRICTAYARGGVAPWTWRPYSGADPHTNHIHVSVGVGPDGRSQPPYDDNDEWLTGGLAPTDVPTTPVIPPSQEDEVPAPAVLVDANGDAFVFVRGTDGFLWFRKGHADWAQVPGTGLPGDKKMTSGPSVSLHPHGITVAMRGPDGATWINTMYDGVWVGWDTYGGSS